MISLFYGQVLHFVISSMNSSDMAVQAGSSSKSNMPAASQISSSAKGCVGGAALLLVFAALLMREAFATLHYWAGICNTAMLGRQRRLIQHWHQHPTPRSCGIRSSLPRPSGCGCCCCAAAALLLRQLLLLALLLLLAVGSGKRAAAGPWRHCPLQPMFKQPVQFASGPRKTPFHRELSLQFGL